jgi:hypothetical protein
MCFTKANSLLLSNSFKSNLFIGYCGPLNTNDDVPSERDDPADGIYGDDGFGNSFLAAQSLAGIRSSTAGPLARHEQANPYSYLNEFHGCFKLVFVTFNYFLRLLVLLLSKF